MKFWDNHTSWEESSKAWEQGAQKAAQTQPVKKLHVLPQIPGITDETAQKLKWKSFKYMLLHDKGLKILRHILKHPLKYGRNYLRSLMKKKGYTREKDFFLYGISSIESFVKLCAGKDTILVVGFSYCQKPHECPSGRFTEKCLCDPDHPVCRQCDIGQLLHALPNKVVPLIIPTVHYIGDQIFKLAHANPGKQILFMITACELTLEMFGDWGNMADIKGLGVRLDGRICNTMKAFELSEVGIKPGLTVVRKETQDQMLDLIRQLRSNASV